MRQLDRKKCERVLIVTLAEHQTLEGPMLKSGKWGATGLFLRTD